MTVAELTLQEAADALGVHYMTAYRYVRLGLLDAEKVGGTWRVCHADLATFRTSNSPDEPHVRRVDGKRRAPWADRLESRLVAGDQRGAWGVVEAALSAGADLGEIYGDVMTPALSSIGDRWACGSLDVSIEHRASVIAMHLIARLGPRFTRRGRCRGQVILGAPSGEHHVLSLAMLADLARQRGWEVSDLGADVPTPSFHHAAATVGDELVAVGLSVSTDRYLPALSEAIAAVRDAAPQACIVVGGRAIIDCDHARALGADHFGHDGREMLAALDAL